MTGKAPSGSFPESVYASRSDSVNTSVEDLNTDLVGLWGSDLDIFDGEGLASFPGDSGLFAFSRSDPVSMSEYIVNALTLQVMVYKEIQCRPSCSLLISLLVRAG